MSKLDKKPQGYWTKERVIYELETIKNKLKIEKFSSTQIIIDNGSKKLFGAFHRCLSIDDKKKYIIQKKVPIEFDSSKKDDHEYMLKKCQEAYSYMAKNKKFTHQDLRDNNLNSLCSAIQKSQVIDMASLNDFFKSKDKTFKIEFDFKKMNSIDYVFCKYNEVLELYNSKRLLSISDLRKNGFSNIALGIVKSKVVNFKDIENFYCTNLLGDNFDIDINKKDNLDYMLCKYNEIIEIFGYDSFIDSFQLKENGFSNFVEAVRKSKVIDFNKIKNFFYGIEFELDFKKINNLSYMLCKSNEVMENLKLKKLFTKEILYNEGYARLANGISKSKVINMKILNEFYTDERYKVKIDQLKKKELNYAISLGYEIMETENYLTFPSINKLIDDGYGNYANVICMYHGGFREFKKHLDFEKNIESKYKIEIDHKKKKKLEYIIEIANTVIKKEGYKRLPGETKLRRDGYSNLACVINVYHGKFPKFRDILESKNMLNEKESLEAFMLEYINLDRRKK